jgi:hypothetical protein
LVSNPLARNHEELSKASVFDNAGEIQIAFAAWEDFGRDRNRVGSPDRAALKCGVNTQKRSGHKRSLLLQRRAH